MPMYRHECSKCSEIVEVFRKVADSQEPPDSECPKCGAREWMKLIDASILRWRYND